jgi:predicted CXXCH cytochrome family protein
MCTAANHRDPTHRCAMDGPPGRILMHAVTAAVSVAVLLAAGLARSQEADSAAPLNQTPVLTTRPALATRPASATRPAPAANPHWNATGCRICHEYTADEPQPIAVEQIDPLCWSCHDGQRAHREVHPVGRLFIEGQVLKPEGWPTPENKLACVTCHDIRSACDHGEARPAVNSAFLRGTPGETPRQFCGHCHLPGDEGHRRYSPHAMLDEQGRIMPQVCLFCHETTVEAAGKMTRTGEADLRSDPVGLCVVCHPRHVDYFDPGHIGYPLTTRMRERLIRLHAEKEAEAGNGPQTQPADAALFLPLADNGRIVCATCHNPHEQGLFPPGSTLGEGAMDPGGTDKRMRLRGLGRDVCRACHDK